MDGEPALVDAFLGKLSASERAPAEAAPGLADALSAMCATALAGWSTPPVAATEFAAWVAERMPAVDGLVAWLGELRAADLYLTCACARGDRRALASLESTYMPGIKSALRSMRAGDASIDEALQRVRERLLVGDGERGPRIAEYAGRGDLRRWLRATAVNTYLNLIRGVKREVLIDDDRVFDAVSTPDENPELAHMKQLYRGEFKLAFTEAVAALSDQEKNLLRYRHVDRLDVDELARIYRVHRATAHRWLASARGSLASATEQALRRRLGIRHSEIDSIRRLVESQIDLSLVRVLRPDREDVP